MTGVGLTSHETEGKMTMQDEGKVGEKGLLMHHPGGGGGGTPNSLLPCGGVQGGLGGYEGGDKVASLYWDSPVGSPDTSPHTMYNPGQSKPTDCPPTAPPENYAPVFEPSPPTAYYTPAPYYQPAPPPAQYYGGVPPPDYSYYATYAQAEMALASSLELQQLYPQYYDYSSIPQPQYRDILPPPSYSSPNYSSCQNCYGYPLQGDCAFCLTKVLQ